MATYTTNYNLTKPTFSELADVRAMNGNMDTIDDVMNASQNSIAPPYDSTESYSEGDMVMYELYLYKCLDDTTGTWDATKWERAYSAESGSSSEVEANPTGTPTDTLNTIGINNVIYGIEGSGGGNAPVKDILFDVPDSTDAWANPITASCDPLDYDLITFEVEDRDAVNLLTFEPYSVGLSDSSGSVVKAYKLSNGDIGYIARLTDAVGMWTSTGTTLTLNKVVGYRFSGAIQPLIYSTEEREIGVWVDNKPLYQKSYLNIGTVTSYTFTDLTDIESIRIVEGASECSNGIPFQYVHPNTANVVGGFFDLTGTNPVLEIRRGGDASGASLEVLTVQYTKTTDTAGSGSYNTLGAPTHHYSTTEQVVGTWIDGSTLYEKTITDTITNTNTTISNTSDVGTLVEGYGLLSDGNGSETYFPYTDGEDYASLYHMSDGVHLLASSWFINNRPNLTVTIRYTKAV